MTMLVNRTEMEDEWVDHLMSTLDDESLGIIRDALSHMVSSFSDMELHHALVERRAACTSIT